MSLVKQLPHRELSEDFSMLEIGVGSNPFHPEATVLVSPWYDPNPNFDFTGNRHYLAVDNGTAVADHSYLGTEEQIQEDAREQLEKYAKSLESVRPEQNIEFRFQDAFELVQLPEKYDEIIMSNVLSSMIGDECAKSLLKLSADVLVEEGLLVTRETFTPEFMKAKELVKLIGGLGFCEVEFVSHKSNPDDYDLLSTYYGMTVSDLVGADARKPDRYFCLARKY